MYGEIVTRLRYKPAELQNNVLTINGTEASLSINPPEIPFPVLSEYEYCTIFLESFETNKDTLYEVKYEIHYKWNELLYKIGEVTSVNGKAEFPRLIKGMSYYVTAIPLDGKYQSKQVRITLDEYDIRQEPVAITTYENPDYKNYEHYLILKNIFGDVAVYLEGNPDYISLDRNDKNLRVYLNKDATERASEFDLIIEDYRIEDIIIARKKILVNDGFSTPYNISIEFTDSNAAIFKWSIDGIYEINKFYISDNIINKGNPIDVIGTSTYIITNYDISKTQYLWLSSLRDGKEKFSDPVTIGAFDKSLNPLIGPSVNYSINQNNDLAVYLNHNSTTVDNYSVYLEENEITSIDGLTPIATSTSKNIVIPNFDVYNNYDRTLKLVATTNKYNHEYPSEVKDVYIGYNWWTKDEIKPLLWFDASDESTIITNSNNEVTTFLDKSGNNFHAYKTENVKAPIYNSTTKCISTFGNTNERIALAGKFINVSETSDYTFFIVAKGYKNTTNTIGQEGSGVNFYVYSNLISTIFQIGSTKSNNSSANYITPVISLTTNRLTMTETKNSLAPFNISFSHNYTDKILITIKRNSGNIFYSLMGNTYSTGAGTLTYKVDFEKFHLFDSYDQGFSNHDLHELIMVKSFIDDETCNKIQADLSLKWSLNNYLPENHISKKYKDYNNGIIDHTPINLTSEFKND